MACAASNTPCHDGGAQGASAPLPVALVAAKAAKKRCAWCWGEKRPASAIPRWDDRPRGDPLARQGPRWALPTSGRASLATPPMAARPSASHRGLGLPSCGRDRPADGALPGVLARQRQSPWSRAAACSPSLHDARPGGAGSTGLGAARLGWEENDLGVDKTAQAQARRSAGGCTPSPGRRDRACLSESDHAPSSMDRVAVFRLDPSPCWQSPRSSPRWSVLPPSCFSQACASQPRAGPSSAGASCAPERPATLATPERTVEEALRESQPMVGGERTRTRERPLQPCAPRRRSACFVETRDARASKTRALLAATWEALRGSSGCIFIEGIPYGFTTQSPL